MVNGFLVMSLVRVPPRTRGDCVPLLPKGPGVGTRIKYYNCTLKLFLLNMLVYEFMIPAANVIKVTPGETIGDALEKVNHECRCTNRLMCR
jgi:hypothetical protein